MLCVAGFTYNYQYTTHYFFIKLKKKQKCQYKLLLQM
jgi:hypothetical protein